MVAGLVHNDLRAMSMRIGIWAEVRRPEDRGRDRFTVGKYWNFNWNWIRLDLQSLEEILSAGSSFALTGKCRTSTPFAN